MGSNFMNPAVRGTAATAARSMAAPQYAARGQSIASQKYLEAANTLNKGKLKPMTRGAAYPKTAEKT